ncbi:MAG: ArnT family glycosyltransferase [Bacteroidales bacterium]
MVLTKQGDAALEAARAGRVRWRLPDAVGRWLWPAVVVALFCVPLFVGLGATDLDNDESGYSFAVEVMVRNGDWLTPKSSPFEDQPFLEKPPLKFWIVAAPIRLGLLPDNEFGLRFADALMGSLAFLYVFGIGRRLGGVVCGLAAVLVLFTHTPLLYQHGLRSNNMEAPVVLAYCGGVYHFLRWRASDRPAGRARHILAIALFFVLGFMTKFVAASFLPLILALMVLAGRADRARFLRDWKFWLGSAGVAILLIAPWFLYQYHQFGTEVWRVMFGAHVYRRFTSNLDPGHVKPWHYYVSMLFAELRQAQVLVVTLVGGLLLAWRTWRRRWPEGALVLLWFALPVAIISTGTSKLYHYAYPFIPPLALCAGYGAAQILAALRTIATDWLRGVDRTARALVRRAITWRWAEWVLVGVAVLACGVAVGTWVQGRLTIHVGDVLLMRNHTVVRPVIVGLVALALAGRLVTCLRAAMPLALLLVLPVGAYRANVALASQEDHPVRTLGACLQPIAARHATDDPRGLGVYIEDDLAAQAFHYYLRGLGRWFRRDAASASDTTIYTALYVPALMRPVLLSSARHDQFMRLVETNAGELLERSARKAGMTPAELEAAAKLVPVSVVRFPPHVLLLPGPYSVCRLPEGAARVR